MDTTTMATGASENNHPTLSHPSILELLERLPYDIRHMVFDELLESEGWYFDFNFYGGVPPLVKALRTRPLAYGHVLEFFQKYNSPIQVNGYSGYDLTVLSNQELCCLTSIQITLNGNILEEKHENQASWSDYCSTNKDRKDPLYQKYRPTDRLIKPLYYAKNLRYVGLYIETGAGGRPIGDMQEWRFLVEFPLWLVNCRKLEVVRVELPMTAEDLFSRTPSEYKNHSLTVNQVPVNSCTWAVMRKQHAARRDALVKGMFKRIYDVLGVQAIFRTIGAGGIPINHQMSIPLCEIWEWRTGSEERFMDWSKPELGRQWSGNGNSHNFLDSDTNFLELLENEEGFVIIDPFEYHDDMPEDLKDCSSWWDVEIPGRSTRGWVSP